VILKLLALGTLPVGLLTAAAAVFGPTVAVIEVNEGGEDGHRFVVPLPLPVVRGTLLVSPAKDLLAENPDWKRVAPAAGRLLEELWKAPDAVLVRVSEPDESVTIRKQGGTIRIDVTGESERVRVRVPIAFVEDVLRRVGDGNLTGRELAISLGRLPRGQLVEVLDGTDHVSVRLY
jgi:hypothetical protein